MIYKLQSKIALIIQQCQSIIADNKTQHAEAHFVIAVICENYPVNSPVQEGLAVPNCNMFTFRFQEHNN